MKGALIMKLEKKWKRGNGEIITTDELIKIVADYIRKNPEAAYDITIGTDSQTHKYCRMVEVICICRIGDGGIFFFRREDIPKIRVLKEKIVEETNRSIENATGFIDALQEELLEDNIDLDIMFDEDRLAFAVHADIGYYGKTKELISEIVAWVHSAGFDCAIKPDSYTASGIANKFSK